MVCFLKTQTLALRYTMKWLMLIPAVMCVEAVVHDVRKREIPDGISIRLLVSGLLATGLSWHDVSFTEAVLGMVVGFVIVLPFTLSDGVGGGDLKLVSGLGVWLGPSGTFQLLFWTALAGMGVALIAAARGQRDFPYAPAILVGLLIAILSPTSLGTLIEWLRQ